MDANNDNDECSSRVADRQVRVESLEIQWDIPHSAGGFAYRYDALGRIVSRAHDLGGATFDRDYAYDDMDRLASDGGTAYAYDAAGNRMTRTKDGRTVTYALGQGDRLASWNLVGTGI